MLSARQALDLLWPRFEPVGAETVPLLAARGRALAEDLAAPFELPRFDHSAMDGYAVRHADLSLDRPLPVHGEARATAGSVPALRSGTAMRIFTGGQLPPGSDTVVVQENTRVADGAVHILAIPKPGANVRRAGSDLQAGAVAVHRGTLLGPGELGLLAALEQRDVRVHRMPCVCLLPTGDELRELGSPDRPGTIVDSNTVTLAAAVLASGCSVEVLPIAPDHLETLRSRIRAAATADLLVTSGGVSVGEYDFVREALRAEGFAIEFHKVAIKPGKPLLFGTRGDARVIGLPGNPVSAFVTFQAFVRPCLERLRGVRAPFPELIPVRLAAATKHAADRLELARARVTRRGDHLLAELHVLQGSGSQPSTSEIDALVLLPPGPAPYPEGTELLALPLGVPHRQTPAFPL